MDPVVQFTVNGRRQQITTDPRRPLLDVLREDLHLTGTHFGCGQGDCGACSVIIDGERAFSCLTPISTLDGKSVTTIEGLSDGEKLHAVQQAFLDEGAYQCGYCVSGMIMAAVALLDKTPHPSDEEIRDGMNGNLCRCCGYMKIMKAIRRAGGRA
jgi:aerobic-type carbon monoxide dehydrogenase small subunit (CoxS/CutS family)